MKRRRVKNRILSQYLMNLIGDSKNIKAMSLSLNFRRRLHLCMWCTEVTAVSMQFDEHRCPSAVRLSGCGVDANKWFSSCSWPRRDCFTRNNKSVSPHADVPLWRLLCPNTLPPLPSLRSIHFYYASTFIAPHTNVFVRLTGHQIVICVLRRRWSSLLIAHDPS